MARATIPRGEFQPAAGDRYALPWLGLLLLAGLVATAVWSVSEAAGVPRTAEWLIAVPTVTAAFGAMTGLVLRSYRRDAAIGFAFVHFTERLLRVDTPADSIRLTEHFLADGLGCAHAVARCLESAAIPAADVLWPTSLEAHTTAPIGEGQVLDVVARWSRRPLPLARALFPRVVGALASKLARLDEATRGRRSERGLGAIHRVLRAMSSGQGFEATVDSGLRALKTELGTDSAWLWYEREDGRFLYEMASGTLRRHPVRRHFEQISDILAEALSDVRPVVVEDAWDNPRVHQRLIKLINIRTLVTVRVTEGSSPVGAVELGWTEGRELDAAARSIIVDAMQTFSLGLSNARARERLSVALSRTEAQQCLAHQVAAHDDVETVMDGVYEVARAVTGCDIVGVVVNDGEQVVGRYARGTDQNLFRQIVRFGPDDASITRWVCAHDQVVAVTDVPADDRVNQRAAAILDIHDAIWAPMRTQQAVYGAALLAWTAPHDITDDDRALAEVIGHDVALAEARHRLLNQLETTNEQLQDHAQALERLNLELANADRLKSEFLANTSHELRTPLNSVLGFIRLVLDGLADDPNEEQQYLQSAYDAGHALLQHINALLDIAKIEAGRMELALSPVSVHASLCHVERLLRAQAQERGIQLRFVPPDRALHVKADPDRLEQVMLNVVGNALKFTPRGWVHVRASRTAVGTVHVEVRDSGVGIAPEAHRRLFRPFSQVDGSTTRRYGGSGLGLAISRNLVEMMGGTIGVRSDGVGRGATAWIELPAAKPATKRERKSA